METSTITWVIAAALAVSEGLAIIPGLKSNSICQLIYFIIKCLANGIKSKEV
jgi:hypothetical protein